jgi:putative transposase
VFGHPLITTCDRTADSTVVPRLTVVTGNGGSFRSFRFEHFITAHPELRHMRARVRSPGQNGSRERGFGSLKYERLFLEEILDALDLVAHAEDYRVQYNTVRSHEAIAWNRPAGVHRGATDSLIPNFPATENLPTT